MKNNLIIAIVLTAAATGGGGFYGGMKYQESKMPSWPANSEQMKVQKNAARSGLSTAKGEVISLDNSSITVKLADNSSKIIILTNSTTVSKSEESSRDDIAEGSSVIITGQSNSDGSITAQNIQVGTGFMRTPGQNSN